MVVEPLAPGVEAEGFDPPELLQPGGFQRIRRFFRHHQALRCRGRDGGQLEPKFKPIPDFGQRQPSRGASADFGVGPSPLAPSVTRGDENPAVFEAPCDNEFPRETGRSDKANPGGQTKPIRAGTQSQSGRPDKANPAGQTKPTVPPERSQSGRAVSRGNSPTARRFPGETRSQPGGFPGNSPLPCAFSTDQRKSPVKDAPDWAIIIMSEARPTGRGPSGEPDRIGTTEARFVGFEFENDRAVGCELSKGWCRWV